MKYIHVYEEFSLTGGGVRSVVSDVCCEMTRKGKKAFILSLYPPEDGSIGEINKWAEKFNINFCVISKRGDNYLKCAIKARHIINKLNDNDKCCLYLHLKRGMLVGILSTLFMKNVVRIEVYHSGYKNYKLQSFVSKPFINRYITVSKDAKRQLVEQFGVNKDKITVIYNGINPSYVKSLVNPIERDKSIIRFLSVGRLSYEKGFVTSIHAYANLRKGNELVDTEYIMAGDGPDKESCIKLADGYVNLLGMIPRSSVYSYMNSADVMIMPSLWEGNSIVLLEVLAIGCAIVATDIPAYREVLGNQPLNSEEAFRLEKFGAVFEKDNLQACMDALKAIYENRYSISSMKAYVTNLMDSFTVQIQARKYIEVANLE